MVDLLDLLDLDEQNDKQEAPADPLSDFAAPTQATDACHICERPANRTCTSCDRRVCAADSWVMFGLCRSCASEDRVKRWNSKRQATGGNWLEDA